MSSEKKADRYTQRERRLFQQCRRSKESVGVLSSWCSNHLHFGGRWRPDIVVDPRENRLVPRGRCFRSSDSATFGRPIPELCYPGRSLNGLYGGMVVR